MSDATPDTLAATTPEPDTVAEAAQSPETPMPYDELGLTDEEYARIRELLGRRPTEAELAMYSVMWSEHCTYKSSKIHLRQFGEKVTENMTRHLLGGSGQNAGVVDIGDGWAATFKVESHNRPSYIDPFQGAATGIGGIVRDIISMGARPVAVMDQLRVGAIDHPDTARILRGAAAGVALYGNTLGVPNIGGELEFDAAYQGNPLVNALCLGVMRHEDIHLANASGVGNKVVLFGARTGGDGIGGASLLASESFRDGEPLVRPNIQVGDPHMEKRIIEACLEMFAAGVVEGIQDLGAAGIACATSELASNGEGGMAVNLDDVPLREELTAGEILMSESQERMMAVVRPEHLEEFLAIAARWEVEAAVIGEVTDTGRLTIDHGGQRIVDVDPRTVAHDGPVYDRPHHRPATLTALNADRAEDLPRPQDADELRGQWLALAASPNLASKDWVTSQLDRYARGSTAMAFPDDAGVVRIDEETGRGVALSTDANGRFCTLDPRVGAQHALAEAYRNVATVGARPVPISDCLNFGSPEEPEAMWQLVEAITGLADGCAELEIPATGGNVSLYNGQIHPTPVVAVLGVVDDVAKLTPSGWREPELAIFLLGTTRAELSGSVWADVVHSHLGGLPPAVDLAAERALAQLLVEGAQTSVLAAAHDLSGGGLAQALTESALRFGVGADIDLSDVLHEDAIDIATALFAESGARALVAVADDRVAQLRDLARRHGVAMHGIGRSRGADDDAQLAVEGVGSVGLGELRALAAATIPQRFAGGA